MTYKAWARASAWLVVLWALPGADAVVCAWCQNNAPSCRFAIDGSVCPTQTATLSNFQVNTGTAAAGTVLTFGPDDARLVDPEYQKALQLTPMQTIMSLVTRNTPGTAFTVAATTSVADLIHAIRTGQATAPFVLERLAQLMEGANAATLADLTNKIKLLSGMKDVITGAVAQAGSSLYDSGVYTFMFAKLSKFVPDHGMDRRAVLSNPPDKDASGASSSHAATIVWPAHEWDYMEILNLLYMFLCTLGICSPAVLSRFLQNAVFNVMRFRGRCWQFAMQLKLAAFREVEDSGGRITLGNVFDGGRLDGLWALAERRFERYHPGVSAFFRTRGRNPQGGRPDDDDATKDRVWNGKFTASAAPCAVFNTKGAKHGAKQLLADGTCKYNHVCYHWVSNKGPAGRCLSNKHAAYECSNPHKCDAKQQ